MTGSSLAGFAALAGVFLLLPRASLAGWETGARAGFDTNVDRSVSDGGEDFIFSGYGAYLRPAGGETRLDWTLSAVLEGAAYARNAELDYGGISITPGLLYNIGPHGTVSIAPFLQYKAVNDTDQSAWMFGGRIDLRQRFGKNLYLGEYGAYTDSRANADTYSYTEFAAGVVFGMNFRSGTFAEIGYEYSRGDSFLTGTDNSVTSGTGGGGGPGGTGGMYGGNSPRYSSTFGTVVVKDKVDSHSVGISAGIDWTPSVFSVANVTYKVATGDVGTVRSQSGFAGIGYRF